MSDNIPKLEATDLAKLFAKVDPRDLIYKAYIEYYNSDSPPVKKFEDLGKGKKLVTMCIDMKNGLNIVKKLLIDPNSRPGITGRIKLYNQEKIEQLNIDGTWVTGYRTAAKSMLMVKNYFSKEDPKSFRIHGCSTQALHHILLIQRFYPKATIEVVGRSKESFSYLVANLKEKELIRFSLVPDHSPAEVVIGVTSSKTPILNETNLKGVSLVIAIGSNNSDVSELEPELIRDFDVIVDSKVSIPGKGELSIAIREKIISPHSILEFSNYLIEKPRFQKPVLFVSKGIVLEDLVIVERLLELQ
jgi:ornithine cyclodeaminase/alanine dehydrogenase-like protein (mu-crystallin family)